jgi:hypothetical protein
MVDAAATRATAARVAGARAAAARVAAVRADAMRAARRRGRRHRSTGGHEATQLVKLIQAHLDDNDEEAYMIFLDL